MICVDIIRGKMSLGRDPQISLWQIWLYVPLANCKHPLQQSLQSPSAWKIYLFLQFPLQCRQVGPDSGLWSGFRTFLDKLVRIWSGFEDWNPDLVRIWSNFPKKNKQYLKFKEISKKAQKISYGAFGAENVEIPQFFAKSVDSGLSKIP